MAPTHADPGLLNLFLRFRSAFFDLNFLTNQKSLDAKYITRNDVNLILHEFTGKQWEILFDFCPMLDPFALDYHSVFSEKTLPFELQFVDIRVVTFNLLSSAREIGEFDE